ncbi:MAG: DUF3054 domain-containing protein [Actinobacteria bacterium]|nr:DUF3054 domain-containing protein [Actinomycetota bacterium]
MTNRKDLAIAATLDVVAILAFVAIGRRSHHEEGAVVGGILRVAAPFLIGLTVGWIVAKAWKAPSDATTGMIIWPVTVVVGMLLRRFLFDDGTALPFIIVASAFTGVLLVGWRALRRR